MPDRHETRRTVAFATLCTLVTLMTAWLYSQRLVVWTAPWTRHVMSRIDPLRRPISPFAYVQYATNVDYLCSAMLNFVNLRRMGTTADLVLLAPETWASESVETIGGLLTTMTADYGVILRYIAPWAAQQLDVDSTWELSLTKLHVLELEHWQRIVYVDSDGVLKRPLDQLFDLPETDLAMTRAYWLGHGETDPKDYLTSDLMVVHPNAELIDRLHRLTTEQPQSGYDMEFLNLLADGNALVLPHRPISMLSGELRGDGASHAAYLGSPDARWNATLEYDRAHYVHFSDWPIPKPWLAGDREIDEEAARRCGGGIDCEEGRLWKGLYDDYRMRRREVCGL